VPDQLTSGQRTGAALLALTGAVLVWALSVGPLVHLAWWLFKFRGSEAIDIGRPSLAAALVGGPLLAIVGHAAAHAAPEPGLVRAIGRWASIALLSGVVLWAALAASPWVEVVAR
jgi:hypothetical protein